MKYGFNLMLFGDVIGSKIQALFPGFKQLGFDGIEVPVFEPGKVDVRGIGEAARQAGLELTCSGALPPGTRFYQGTARAQAGAIKYISDGIKVVAGLGAKVWVGPLYKAVGDFDESIPLEQQRAETAAALKPLLKEAQEAGVVLGFEPINRFETNLINTVAQGIDFCRQLDSPNAALLLDTFHLHIEEKDSASAVAAGAEVFAHFHCSENDRGIPGTGQVHWREIAEAVKRTGYDQWAVLETFNQDNQAIKAAASCWRPFYPNEDEFLRQGLAFIRKLFNR
jgi:D-psicose/D-tagatose/L-ribulose 3-epimerase